MYIDEHDPQTIIFAYPKLFQNISTLPVIRLEIGALAAWTPSKAVDITSYAAKYYPFVFEQATTSVLTVLPERTFWEKATILHHEANRPQTSPMPMRYARHYYDLFCMANSSVKEAAFGSLALLKKVVDFKMKFAFGSLALLKKVVDFKMKFYPRSWADYPAAKPGTLKLVPPDFRLPELQADYDRMKYMIYGEIPTFEQIMACITDLENEINLLRAF